MQIDILGAGAFGSALAIALGQNNYIRLVALPKHLNDLFTGKNALNLSFPSSVEFDSAFRERPDVVLVATPAQEIKNITPLLETLPYDVPIVFCSKGLYIEKKIPYLMTTYAALKLKNPLLVLSGPNFANEIAALKPSFANIAGPNAESLCETLSQSHFILVPWHDSIGLQIAGCFKNVAAIAAGYFDGKGCGLNERAALFPQILEEMICFGQHFWPENFDRDTLLTYGGIGDLVLTCTSIHSRNYKLGRWLAQGGNPHDLQETAEGVHTARAIHAVSKNLKLPICALVYDILND